MPGEVKAQPAVRLVFEYDGNSVRLLSQIPVTMAVPDADPGQAIPGVYVDSRNADDVPLARVRVHGAMPTSREVFPEKAGERPHRIERQQRGAFSAVVPTPQDARHVTVVRLAVGPAAAATDLASFALRPR